MLNFLFPIVIVLLIILFFNERLKGNNSKSATPSDSIYPYEKHNYLLTIAEKNFYDVLSLAINDTNYYICPKVRLADVIKVGRIDKRQVYFNKIQSKHIDFVLCDKNSLVPLLAIELDDSSHLKDDRIQRDHFIDNALKAAGLKLIRFNVGYAYTFSEVKEKLDIKVPIN